MANRAHITYYMLSHSFKELFAVACTHPEHSISKVELDSFLPKYQEYTDLFLSRNQGFLDLPYDDENVENIVEFAEENKSRYDYFVVLGIGGSMLGPQTIVSALKPRTINHSVFFVDNIDPCLLFEIIDQIELSKTLFLVQTKSGGTPETISQFSFFADQLKQVGLELKDHMVAVTDPEKGYLRQIATKLGISTFPIPENVGGRFSVLSSVGLLLSALLGIDIKLMLQGAAEVKEGTLEGSDTTLFEIALVQYLLSLKGKTSRS
jgi:glucose-6-phosphate isomerase